MHHRVVRFVTVVLLAVVLFSITSLAQAPVETKEARDARMAWWREAKFGMFIHWGLYAIPAGVWKGQPVDNAGEWIMFNGKILPADYEPLKDQFNPVKFDANDWVKIAKDAGVKYITITTKHHDGFCLFDSKLTDYDVMSTPFKRDIMKELSDACAREGIKMCWYHSVMDWHQPDYLPRGEGSPRPWDTRPKDGASYDRYIQYMQGQLRELLTNYGNIGVLWFDGGWEHTAEEHHAQDVVAMIRGIQPKIIINNRIKLDEDFSTPEQEIPATGLPGRDWETCMTMNDTWGFKSADTNWKSSEDLIRKLVDIASKGGNFLLNVGPTAEGLIPQPSVERLAAMGAWMKVNGESIYGTTASPFRQLAWGRCTTKPDTLYLQVFDWPADGKLVVPGLKNEITGAYLLADAKQSALQTARDGDNAVVNVPAGAPDKIASVVVLKIKGVPDVVNTAFSADKDGVFELKAALADLHGPTLKYEPGKHNDNIGFWVKPDEFVSWDVNAKAPGKYAISIVYACDKGVDGSEYEIAVDGNPVLTGKVAATGAWTTFNTESIGKLSLEPGKHNIAVRPKTLAHGALINLRSVTLKPD